RLSPGHPNHRGIRGARRRSACLRGGWFGSRTSPGNRAAPEGPARPFLQNGRHSEDPVSECADCRGCAPAAVVEIPRPAAIRTVALAGPPNSGKSTLFNRLTGLRQKVANFPGVTVEQHTGIAHLPDGRSLGIIDLPGIYSLSPRSEDEQVAYDILHGKRAGTPKPGAVLLVLDSTNLSRHLMLAAPILSLGVPVLIILNMADDLRARGGAVDLKKLSEQLGAPVALINARGGVGIDRVFEFLAGAMPRPQPALLPIL